MPDYESTQWLHVGIESTYVARRVIITLRCVCRASAALPYSRIDGKEPAQSPLFEAVRIEFGDEPMMKLTWGQLISVTGEKQAKRLMDLACRDAERSGIYNAM